MISSVLVANRGEIARRVFATCRRRGIAGVAVFSDADADSPHVREADSAVRLPGDAPAETYLRGDLVIAAAQRAGADAVHPGYGFLSENAEFARAVRDAGLTWIGPEPEAIETMGSKVAAKKLMADAGVPVLERLDPDSITDRELPVLVKASAGGGGRGMRIVRRLEDLPEAIAGASAEAESAFGDSEVFCERYLPSGHHVEVQILSDAHGTVWALGERECSLQRRHQKVIEEAPSPLVDRLIADGDEDLRDRLLAAGRDAAAAVGYVGAGTVEFLADDRGRFWFLEMNTRLQVEHPVTECVTGTDLVGLQFDVAEGRPLVGEEPTMRGHAIEARLYAEDPSADWQPQTGAVVGYEVPDVVSRFAVPSTRGLRLDSGVEVGSEIGTHYDAMLAKVIVHDADREAAARALAAALRRSRIHGVVTNRDLLVGSLLAPAFLDGTADTGFYDAHRPSSLIDEAGIVLDPALAALVAALAEAAAESGGPLAGIRSGFRNVPYGFRTRRYAAGEEELEVGYRLGRPISPSGPGAAGTPVEVATPLPLTDRIVLVDWSPDAITLELDGLQQRWRLTRYTRADGAELVAVDGARGSITLRRLPRFVDPAAQLPAGALVAPMPGSVIRVGAEAGDTVTAGQPVVWLEAMKMEHVIQAPAAGVLTEIAVTLGQQVAQGTTLAVVEVADEAE